MEKGRPETMLGVIAELGKLAPEDRVAFRRIFQNGPMDEEVLSKMLGFEGPALRKTLNRLESRKLVSHVEVAGVRFYKSGSYPDEQRYSNSGLIPLSYQFNLLCDAERTDVFAGAVERAVRPNDLVVELGAGSGILSLVAARKARKVYSVEIDQAISHVASRMAKATSPETIEVICADARKVSLPERADLIICEMIDTALLAEPQVEVMNYAVKNLLAEGGRVIPEMAETFMEAIHVDFEVQGLEFKLPHYEDFDTNRVRQRMSPKVKYHEVLFDRQNDRRVKSTVMLPTQKEGIVNALRLTTSVRVFSDGAAPMTAGGTSWFAPPLILPTRDLTVCRGDNLKVLIDYQLGSPVSKIKYETSVA